jgi:hypothetical protein
MVATAMESLWKRTSSKVKLVNVPAEEQDYYDRSHRDGVRHHLFLDYYKTVFIAISKEMDFPCGSSRYSERINPSTLSASIKSGSSSATFREFG